MRRIPSDERHSDTVPGRNRRRILRACALALGLAVACACGGATPAPPLVLATTTSVANSGLLDGLLAAYREQRGTVIRSHLVGSGLALRMLEKGDVDFVISHAPEAEAVALVAHPGWRYRKIMFNDFVLVGPPGDPAAVRGAETAAAAMRRIAGSDARFISRGDSSGTHEREQQLWTAAGARPARLVVAGSGMGATLRIAGETAAYTLTDRATLAQHDGALQLAIVFEGGPALLNTYAVTVDPGGRHAAGALDFFEWITGGRGREVIDGYRIRGVPAFAVWPANVPGVRPDAQPPK